MKYDMKKWLMEMTGIKPKKAIPVLSFPCVSLLGITVRELISDSTLQAKAMPQFFCHVLDHPGITSRRYFI